MSDGVAADKEAAAKRQLSLFGAFKKFVWIERSDAVGRDKTLSSNQETVWPLLRTDAPLVALMAAWSMKAVNEATKKIARFEKEVQSAWKLDGAEAQFKQVAEDASWAAKRVAMVESIAQTGGMQMPYGPLPHRAVAHANHTPFPSLCLRRARLTACCTCTVWPQPTRSSSPCCLMMRPG